MTYMRLIIDPTELEPGDIVVALNDHDESGCHCDVVVTVDRPSTPRIPLPEMKLSLTARALLFPEEER